MSETALRILCAGDLHIGRRSSKLPDTHSGPEHSCGAAWDAIVDTALIERVDIVALSGDLVDRDNRYFEAIGPLERGLRRLADAGIDSYAVSGNHDFDVLPQLADALALERFHLLGRGGQWERKTIQRDGRPVLHIDGWSFPQQDVSSSALETYEPSSDGTPVLGLLHADLDQPGSRYDPVGLEVLQSQRVAMWLLGHIHGEMTIAVAGKPVVMYPGSPQAMDPGEGGLHGATLATIDPTGRVTTRRIPLSTVRYLPLTVDLSDTVSDEDIRSKIVSALRDALARDEHRYERLTCLSCRVTLTGRTAHHGKLRGIAETASEDLNLTNASGVEAIIERIDIETRPAIDLDAIAGRNDPPGEVAKFIRALDDGEGLDLYGELIAATTRQLRGIHDSSIFSGIAVDDAPDDARVLRNLRAEAWSLLDALIAQKEPV